MITFFAVPGVGYGECEPDVVAMLGNGVWNDAEDADESRDLLQIRLETHISGTSLEGKISYDTSHNPSEGALEDLLETFEQIIQINCKPFDKNKFSKAVNAIRLLTVKAPDEFIPEMRIQCSKVGVALSLIPEMKKVLWNGATR
jgi:hypothetical protein